MAQDIEIRTRHGREKTFQVEFDDNWISEEDWELPVYEVDPINEGNTIVKKLRIKITNDDIIRLVEHLSSTYAYFIKDQGVTIKLNDKEIEPKFFDNWSYPPQFEPRRYSSIIHTSEGAGIQIVAIAGLGDASSPASGEYGVYFYCNDRLIVRALKTFDVGFAKGLAGLPHPKISLTKVILRLNGSALSMPWNSSKSDISTKHEVFQAIHDWLVQVVKDYASLSRAWMGDWPEKVFKYKDCEITDVPVYDFPAVKKSFLPPTPKSRPKFSEVVSQVNSAIVKKRPLTKGLYEGVIAA